MKTHLLVVGFMVLFSMTSVSSEFRKGAELFSTNCVLCHGSKGMGEGYLPMKLSGYPSTNLLTSFKAKEKRAISQVISNGVESPEINEYMPPWKGELSVEEIDHLAEFIVYLREDTVEALKLLKIEIGRTQKTVGDGKMIFKSRCILCHGIKGEGDGRLSKVINNPPPADLTASRLPASYLKLIIANGGQGVGRSPKMPPWGDLMADNEISAVIEYIMTIRD